MQCGPIRHEVNAKKQASERPFDHFVIQRHKDFEMPSPVSSKHSMTHIYQALVTDDLRNQFILNDIKKALFEKRSLLVLTERREHVLLLANQIQVFVKNVFVMQGGMDAQKRELLISELQAILPFAWPPPSMVNYLDLKNIIFLRRIKNSRIFICKGQNK
jgi:hypothetical protein